MAVGLVEPGESGRRVPGQAEQEPSLQEIVLALRDVAAADGTPAPSRAIEPSAGLYRLQPAREVAAPPRLVEPPGAEASAAAPGGADPRDAEIVRLVEENHRLNQRLFALLTTLERERRRGGERADAAPGPVPVDRDAVARQAREAIRRELGPLLSALVRILDNRAAAAGQGPETPPAPTRPEAAPPRQPSAAPSAAAPIVAGNGHSFNWVVDLLHSAEVPPAAVVEAAPALRAEEPTKGLFGATLRRLGRRRSPARTNLPSASDP